jgi:Ion channel
MRRPLLRRLVWLRLNRCSALLVALCLMILLAPFMGGSRLGTTMLGLATLVVLVIAVWALRAGRRMFWAVAALALLTALGIVTNRFGLPALRPLSLLATAVFIGAVTIALLIYVLDRRPITTDKVFGAVAAYVLIAFSFASLFSLLQLLQPDAFYVNAVNEPDGHLGWSAMMYFSFTVLTSTGFGEITPVSHMARSLIVLEQVLGVMYVAFLVARLANLWGRREA